ncbi:MAG: DNA alkylation repair protein [Bacteroidota bacterium]
MHQSSAEVISKLKAIANPDYTSVVARFGIPTEQVIGIKSPEIKKISRSIGVNHSLAIKLWNTPIHEARILATLIADPTALDIQQAEQWAQVIYSWDLCDSICRVFYQMDEAYEIATRWTIKKEEFVKRAAFVTMVMLTIHAKKLPDEKIASFFPYIIKEAWDNRNFVKKSVNWALRQIGKRSLELNKQAIVVAHEIKNQGTNSAKWIANDALKELTSKAVINRLHLKAQKNVSSGS